MLRARPTSVRLARLPVLLLATVLALVLAVAIQPARPAYAAAALVQNLGNSVVSGPGTMTITTTGTVQAGNSIIVSVGSEGVTGFQCSDPVNGAYTVEVFAVPPGAGAAICSKHGIT